MKAKELTKLLSEYPDFDVTISFVDKNGNNIKKGVSLRDFEITRISGVIYSPKNIFLEFREITKK